MVSDTPHLSLDAWRVTGRLTQHYLLHMQEGKINLVSKHLAETFFVVKEENNMEGKSAEEVSRN